MESFKEIRQLIWVATAQEVPAGHSGMALGLWHLACRSWDAMVAATSSSNIGLVIWTVSIAVGIWAAHRLKNWIEIRKRCPGWAGLRATLRSSIPETLWDVGATVLIVIAWWMVFVVRTVYFEHFKLSERVNHLSYYAAHEERYEHDLNEAQAKANHWRDAYTGISKGEIVPDRIMNREDTEKLHDKLEEYKKASKERKYSIVRIGPAFSDDQESKHLSFNLLKVFRAAHWEATWEGGHSKELTALLLTTLPKGVVIFSDDPRNEALWIMTMLQDIGIFTTISDKVPNGFKGTLICVGYKMFEPLSL